MQSIFQTENADKALKYRLYRHLPAYEKIIRNLVSFYPKKAYISGASAKATASFKQYKKDVYLQTITRTVTISCNKSGKLY